MSAAAVRESGERLQRRLGTGDAVVIGLGSMIGAGVFAVWEPAAAAAGAGLLFGLLIAGVVAFCNATSSAQLAVQYPTSGGTYVYGRVRLGAWPGFMAGWGFVVGKTASAAAMALTVAAYALPGTGTRPGLAARAVAVLAVLVLVGVNLLGITRTAAVTRVLVALTVTVLVVWVAVVLLGGRHPATPPALTGLTAWTGLTATSTYGVLQSAGLLFFAFAGYARIATLAEEVREPRRTIPRAVVTALLLVLAIYLVIAVTTLEALPATVLARTPVPLAAVASAAGASWLVPAVRIAAVLASLGALLALLAGISRTGLAMAREGDLPRFLDAVGARHRVPHRMQILAGIVVLALVLVGDLRAVVGFSSFGVLVYYAVANAAAWTQRGMDRRWPRALQCLGMAGCVVLVATLPVRSIVAGLVIFAIGIVGRVLARRHVDRRAAVTEDVGR